jgi:hypothetical protein
MPDNNENKGLDPRTQIILAVVGLVGTVSVALFTNWDKLSASNKSPSPTPSAQLSTRPSNPANTIVSLSIGDWKFNGNGSTGTLKISSIDGNGNVQGSVFGDPIIGFWDEDAQKITFIRDLIGNSGMLTVQGFQRSAKIG